jgi:TrmH family RNA methyltransferase
VGKRKVLAGNVLAGIRVVLVNPSHPGNIGAVARAMKTMGLSALWLVDPDCFPHEQATRRAAGAQDLLENAVVTSTLEEALQDCTWVAGTSARARKIPWPLMPPGACARQAVLEAQHQPVGLVFGREDRGLTNEQLAQCNVHVHIPTAPGFSSLNLASAVQVLAYEIQLAVSTLQSGMTTEKGDTPADLATCAELEGYFLQLEAQLFQVGFLDKSRPGNVMARLRRLYARARPERHEISILRGILRDTGRAIASGSGTSVPTERVQSTKQSEN